MFYVICLVAAVLLPVFALIYMLLSKPGAAGTRQKSEDAKQSSRQDMFALSVAELLGGVFILLPVSFDGHPWPENILFTIFNTLKLTTFGGDFGAMTKQIHALMGDGWFSVAYASVYQVLAILLPITLVAGLFTLLYERIPYITTFFAVKAKKNLYVFSGLNEKTKALITSISSHDDDKNAFFVVAELSKADKDKRSSVVADLKDATHHNIAFLPCAVPHTHLIPRGGNTLLYFLFSDFYNKNIETCVALRNSLATDLSKRYEEGKAVRIASQIRIVCLHSNEEGELIIDSKSAPSSDEDENSGAFETIRKAIRIRLLREKEEVAWCLLRENPLYSALDQSLISFEDNTVRQTLNVVIIGLGSMGVEILRACYWLGRLQSTALHIYAIDRNADVVRSRMETQYAEMVADVQDDGTPTINFVVADIYDASFRANVISRASGAHSYTFVTAGTDENNFNIGLEMRRIMDEVRIIRMKEKLASGLEPETIPNPKIAIYTRGKETARALKHLKSDRNEPYDFICFGSNEEVFNYENLVNPEHEIRCVRMNGIYDLVYEFNSRIAADPSTDRYQALAQGVSFSNALKGFNKFEIKKRSNRAGVLFIPYRAWMLGLGKQDISSDSAWYKALGLCNPCTSLPEIFDDFGAGLREDEFVEKLNARLATFAEKYPIMWRLTQLEHSRWLAFYQAQGWRDITVEDMKALNLANGNPPLKEHQSPKMRRHCYMCSFEELIERGLEIGEDPTVYDMAMIAYSCHVYDGKALFGKSGL